MIVSYKLKDHVTNEMLKSIGFRISHHGMIKAVRLSKTGTSNGFIDVENEVNAWKQEDIQDMIDKGWVEEIRNE